MATESHYSGPSSDAYFRARGSARDEGEQLRRAGIFAPSIQPTWSVLDFGCGDGAVIAALACTYRAGVEIGPEAAAEARARGVDVRPALDEFKDRRFDAILSSHALEHVEAPLATLRACSALLNPGGALLLLLPAENPMAGETDHWHEEINKHLYAWTPLALGNLVTAAGFDVTTSVIRPMESQHSRPLRLISRLAPRLLGPAMTLRARLKWKYEIFLIAHRQGGAMVPP